MRPAGPNQCSHIAYTPATVPPNAQKSLLEFKSWWLLPFSDFSEDIRWLLWWWLEGSPELCTTVVPASFGYK
jgi:hypothetical protein